MLPPEARTLSAAGLALAGTLIVLAPASGGETPQQKLRSVERELQQGREQQEELTRDADALELELQALRADGIRAAEAVQTHETALSALEVQLRLLSTEAAQKQDVIARNHAQEAQLLAVLARLALNPPEALALGPLAPQDAVRTGILLGRTAPRLQQEARSLSLELADLRRLRHDIERNKLAVELERRGLDTDQQRLDGLIQRKTALRDQALQGAEETKQRLAKLSAQAGDLHDLILKLDAERKAREAERKAREAARQAQIAAIPRPDASARPETVTAPPPATGDRGRPRVTRPFETARGAMVYPASGTLALRYGELDEFGASSKGLTLITRAGAVVVAPYDGQVEFAGPFKGYGQILIIQHGDGYHSLLAGLDRIDGVAGDWLVAGEPVGAMGSSEPNPRLYLELRHNGQPINPLPWLATRDEKVSG